MWLFLNVLYVTLYSLVKFYVIILHLCRECINAETPL